MQTCDDADVEGDETFTIIPYYEEGATIEDGEATCTICDNDS